MRKWAYWTGYIEDNKLPAELNKMGEDGWELASLGNAITIRGEHWGEYIKKIYCVFKRPSNAIERL